MTIRDVGDRVAIRHEVRDADGTLTNATVAVAVTKPDGTTLDPAPTVTNPSTGIYDAAFTLTAAGKWRWKWTVSGTVVEVAHGEVDAQDPAPPTYISLTTLKTALKITDTDRDVLLTQALTAAARKIDTEARGKGGHFYADSVATARIYNPRGRAFRTADGEVLLVDDIATETGLTVEVGDGTTWTALADTEWDTYPDNAIAKGRPVEGLLRLRSVWWIPGGLTRVRVTTKWGWPVVPDEVPEATFILATRYFMRKDSPEGVAGSAEWGVIRLSRTDPDVYDLIKDLTVAGFGGGG